tara:strand:- start:1358 stop:1498 length:141 start_codon:yes stop_codon:yes gene_type:complete
MYPSEEKIYNAVKLTIIFLITMLGVAIFDKMFMIMLLVFYIAFLKE